MTYSAFPDHVSGVGCESRIARNEDRAVEYLSEGEVDRVVGRQVVAELPDARSKRGVRVPDQPHLVQLRDRVICLRGRDFAVAQEAPKRVQGLWLD